MACVTSTGMKTATSRLSYALGSGIATLFMAMGSAWSGDTVSAKELEVIEVMAAVLNQDAAGSYDYLYFESDFSAGAHIASSLENPDRTQFCGLTRSQAQSLVTELEAISAKPVEFDKSAVKEAGLKIGHKKLPRFRYLMLSRVVFAPDNLRAWLAVNLNGETGAIMRLDKIDGRWNKTQRCGGWVKAPE
jgi:hypothetical protein